MGEGPDGDGVGEGGRGARGGRRGRVQAASGEELEGGQAALEGRLSHRQPPDREAQERRAVARREVEGQRSVGCL